MDEQNNKLKIIFSTTNKSKVYAANLLVDNYILLEQRSLKVTEFAKSEEDIVVNKVIIAYEKLKLPVVADDSGFYIVSLNNYPGIMVGRELKKYGLKKFQNLPFHYPLESYFKMSLAFFDSSLEKPLVFTNIIKGLLINNTKGDINKPFVKSAIGGSFIPFGFNKTIAEMTELEYVQYSQKSNWTKLLKFLMNSYK